MNSCEIPLILASQAMYGNEHKTTGLQLLCVCRPHVAQPGYMRGDHVICVCSELTLQSPDRSLWPWLSFLSFHTNSGLTWETHHTSRPLITLGDTTRQTHPCRTVADAVPSRACVSVSLNAACRLNSVQRQWRPHSDESCTKLAWHLQAERIRSQ